MVRHIEPASYRGDKADVTALVILQEIKNITQGDVRHPASAPQAPPEVNSADANNLPTVEVPDSRRDIQEDSRQFCQRR